MQGARTASAVLSRAAVALHGSRSASASQSDSISRRTADEARSASWESKQSSGAAASIVAASSSMRCRPDDDDVKSPRKTFALLLCNAHGPRVALPHRVGIKAAVVAREVAGRQRWHVRQERVQRLLHRRRDRRHGLRHVFRLPGVRQNATCKEATEGQRGARHGTLGTLTRTSKAARRSRRRSSCARRPRPARES